MGQHEHAFFDGQVILKFTDKGHKYHRKIESNPITVDFTGPEQQEITIPNAKIGEWELITSASKIAKGAFDKIQLSNWMIDSALSQYVKYRAKGLDQETAIDKAKGYRWEVMRKAGKIGSAVHDWIHLNILRELGKLDYDPEWDETNSKLNSCIEAFLAWEEANVVKYLDTEIVVYNPILDVVGTMDFSAVVKDGTTNCYDVKTGSGVWEADFMQVAFYRKAYRMSYGVPTDNAILLHVKDKKTIKEHPAKDADLNATAFECANFLFRWKTDK